MKTKLLLSFIFFTLFFVRENIYSQNYNDKSIAFTLKTGLYDVGEGNSLGKNFYDFGIDIGKISEYRSLYYYANIDYVSTRRLFFTNSQIVNKNYDNVKLFNIGINGGVGSFGKINSYYQNKTNIFGYYLSLGIGLIYYNVPNVIRINNYSHDTSNISSYNSLVVNARISFNLLLNVSKKIAFNPGFDVASPLGEDENGYSVGYFSFKIGIIYTPDF